MKRIIAAAAVALAACSRVAAAQTPDGLSDLDTMTFMSRKPA